MAAPDVLARLRAMGSPNPAVRSGLTGKAGECVTDNGMWIVDAPFPLVLARDVEAGARGDGQGGVWEVEALAAALIRIPGVVEIGLFTGGEQAEGQKPAVAYLGTPEGKVQVQQAR